MNTEDIKNNLELAAANYIQLATLISTIEGLNLAQDAALIEPLDDLRLAMAELAIEVQALSRLGDHIDGIRKRARPALRLVKR